MTTIPIPTAWYREFHFLDVGHGDCTIVDFPNRLTVVDINNCKTLAKESEEEIRNRYRRPLANPLLIGPYSAAGRTLGGLNGIAILSEALEAERKLKQARDKLTNPIDYLKARFAGRPIFRYIQTHPDMDHMAGLHRITEEKIEIVNLWDTHHAIQKDEDALKSANVNKDIQDWHTYLRLRASTGTNPTVLRLTNGASGDFWTPDGISIWAPFDHKHAHNSSASPNDLSYLLHVQIGRCSVVLGGDTTAETWEQLYKANNGKLPKVHLLKASHHGRKSGYHLESVKAMNPDVTIVSVGELKKKDDAAASYERFSNKGCYTTVDHGDIIARCWSDGDVWLRERDGDWFLKSGAAA